MRDYLRLIDHNTNGARCDVTPLFADGAAFASLVADLVHPFEPDGFDVVAGIDALGFILAAAIANHTGKGLVPLRKAGKLPVAADTVEFVDYSGEQKGLELRIGAVSPGTRVLLVDEWVETAAQITAAVKLLERHGAVVAGIAAIEMDDNAATRRLSRRYRCHAVSGWLAAEPEPAS